VIPPVPALDGTTGTDCPPPALPRAGRESAMPALPRAGGESATLL